MSSASSRALRSIAKDASRMRIANHPSRLESKDVFGERGNSMPPDIEIIFSDGARNSGPVSDDDDPPEEGIDLDDEE